MNLSILFNLSLSIAISTCILHRGGSTAGLCMGEGLNCLFNVKCFSALLLAIGNIAIWGDHGPCSPGSAPVLQIDTLHKYTTSSLVNCFLQCRNAGKFRNMFFGSKSCITNPLSARMRLLVFKKTAAYSSSNANVERKKYSDL